MITDSFSLEEPIIKPEMIYRRSEKLLDVCLITFSWKIFQEARNMEGSKVVGTLSAASGKYDIISLPIEGRRVGIFLSTVGAPACGGFMEDAHALTGAESFILFGSAGTLDEDKTKGKFIIPTSAYRDEGLSYHYLEKGDYVELEGWRTVEKVFASLKVPYVLGRTWTPDAFYRETRRNAEERRAEGCIAVEMEIAGAASVAIHHNWHFYAFLESGDSLEEEWRVSNLMGANHNALKLALAMETAKGLSIDN